MCIAIRWGKSRFTVLSVMTGPLSPTGRAERPCVCVRQKVDPRIQPYKLLYRDAQTLPPPLVCQDPRLPWCLWSRTADVWRNCNADCGVTRWYPSDLWLRSIFEPLFYIPGPPLHIAWPHYCIYGVCDGVEQRSARTLTTCTALVPVAGVMSFCGVS